MKRLIFCLLAVLCFCSCRNWGKTYIKELKFIAQEDYLFVYTEDGEPFDGEVWSSDNRIMAEVECGVLGDITIFFSTGEKCFKGNKHSHQEP